MKRLFTIALGLCIGLESFAFAGNSRLVVRSANGAPIQVTIDGISSTSGLEATFEQIQPGNHLIKVKEAGRNYGRYEGRLIYRGEIQIQPNTMAVATVDHFGMKLTATAMMPERHDNWDRHDRDHHGNHDWHGDDDHYRPVPTSVIVPNGQQYAPGCSERAYAISNNDFQRLCFTLNNCSFESTRLSVLQQASRNFYFETSQVEKLMQLFNFESNKLEVAKSLYTKVVDPQNFYEVCTVFNYNSSINDLNNFLASR
ncbi:MAG: DUF4476 domain-containing protein [Chitinophagales bacterium]